MSIWTDKKGRTHVGVMQSGQRLHRTLPPGTAARDAKLLEAHLWAELASAQKTAADQDPPLTQIMGLYIAHAEQALRSADTATHHATRIGPWAEMYTASQAQICADHIVRDMANNYAPATINRSLGTLKRGLNLAWRQGLTKVNHGATIQRLAEHNEREDFPSVAQVQAIAAHCSLPVQAAIWTGLLTGARQGEVVKIKAEHIGPDAITIPSSHTKMKRAKTVPIVSALRPWLKHLPLTITAYAIKSAWRRARVKAGLPSTRFHDLRHSCASILIESGVDLYTVGQILGHTQVQTTKRYAHLQLKTKAAALDHLSQQVMAQAGSK